MVTTGHYIFCYYTLYIVVAFDFNKLFFTLDYIFFHMIFLLLLWLLQLILLLMLLLL